MLRAILAAALLISVGSTSRADDGPGYRERLRSALEKQRKAHLANFHKYRVKRVYPHNKYEPDMRNVWKDRDDHLCAIATLVNTDGLTELVDEVATKQNFVKISDLTDGPLVDWVLTSGLTQEEVVMIQAPTQADVEEMEWQQRKEERKLARALRREDDRLAANYLAVERALGQARIADAGLELAVARLAAHPELADRLLTASVK